MRRSPFRLWPIQVPTYVHPVAGLPDPSPRFSAPEIDPFREKAAWWYIAIWQGALSVHPGGDRSRTPYTLLPGAFMRIHRENMPEFTLTNSGFWDAIGVVVYTGDKDYRYQTPVAESLDALPAPFAWYAGRLMTGFANNDPVPVVTDFMPGAYHALPAGTAAATITLDAFGTGLHAFHFDGTVMLQTGAFTLNQPCTIYFVAQYTGASADVALYVDDLAGNRRAISHDGAHTTMQAYAGNAASATVADQSLPFIAGVVFNSLASVIGVNAAETTGLDVGLANGSGLTIGAYGGTGYYITGDIAEIVLFPAAHSAAVRALVYAQLNKIYKAY